MLLGASAFVLITLIPQAVGADGAGWKTVHPFVDARDEFDTVAGLDGRIYVIGGWVGGGDCAGHITAVCYTSSVVAYNPVSDSWSFVASLPDPLAWPAAAVGSDGKIYVISGYDAALADDTNAVEVYDPGTNTWSKAAPDPNSRYRGAATAGTGGRIYVMGGVGCSSSCSQVDIYDPRTNSWTTAAPIPTARDDVSVVTEPDGRIFTIGGSPSSVDGTHTVEVYDPKINTWSCSVGDTAAGCQSRTIAPTLEMSVLNDAAAGPDGMIYLVHPRTLLTVDKPPIEVWDPDRMFMEYYDPSKNQWIEGLAPSLQQDGDVVYSNGVLYIVGGGRADVDSYRIAPPIIAPSATVNGCTFVLGFKVLHDLIPEQVGDCIDAEGHNPENGDALQHTKGGLLVWRKGDNWTAFTDGYHTWVNGPTGLQERLNSQRFSWEANPGGLPIVNG